MNFDEHCVCYTHTLSHTCIYSYSESWERLRCICDGATSVHLPVFVSGIIIDISSYMSIYIYIYVYIYLYTYIFIIAFILNISRLFSFLSSTVAGRRRRPDGLPSWALRISWFATWTWTCCPVLVLFLLLLPLCCCCCCCCCSLAANVCRYFRRTRVVCFGLGGRTWRLPEQTWQHNLAAHTRHTHSTHTQQQQLNTHTHAIQTEKIFKKKWIIPTKYVYKNSNTSVNK